MTCRSTFDRFVACVWTKLTPGDVVEVVDAGRHGFDGDTAFSKAERRLPVCFIGADSDGYLVYVGWGRQEQYVGAEVARDGEGFRYDWSTIMAY